MSFDGIKQFDKNLRTVMDSEAFKKGDASVQLDLGYRLLRSKYGIGSWFGFGKVHALPEKEKSN